MRSPTFTSRSSSSLPLGTRPVLHRSPSGRVIAPRIARRISLSRCDVTTQKLLLLEETPWTSPAARRSGRASPGGRVSLVAEQEPSQEHETRKRATAEVSAQSSTRSGDESRAELLLLLLPQNICFHLERLHSAEVPLPVPSGPGPPTRTYTHTNRTSEGSAVFTALLLQLLLLLLLLLRPPSPPPSPPPRWNFELFLENTACACEREHLKDPPPLSPQPITDQQQYFNDSDPSVSIKHLNG